MRDEATDRRYPPIGSRSAGSCPQHIQDHVGPCEGPQSGLQMQTLVAGQESQESGAFAVARPTLPSPTPPLPRFQRARLVRVGSFDHLVGAQEERLPPAQGLTFRVRSGFSAELDVWLLRDCEAQ